MIVIGNSQQEETYAISTNFALGIIVKISGVYDSISVVPNDSKEIVFYKTETQKDTNIYVTNNGKACTLKVKAYTQVFLLCSKGLGVTLTKQ